MCGCTKPYSASLKYPLYLSAHTKTQSLLLIQATFAFSNCDNKSNQESFLDIEPLTIAIVLCLSITKPFSSSILWIVFILFSFLIYAPSIKTIYTSWPNLGPSSLIL